MLLVDNRRGMGEPLPQITRQIGAVSEKIEIAWSDAPNQKRPFGSAALGEPANTQARFRPSSGRGDKSLSGYLARHLQNPRSTPAAAARKRSGSGGRVALRIPSISREMYFCKMLASCQ